MTSSIYPLTAPSWMVRQAIPLPGVHDLITRSKTTHLAKQKAQMNPHCSSGGLRIVIKAVNCSMSLWMAYLTAVSHCGLGQLLYLKHESRLRPAYLEMCWWAEHVVLLRSISGTFWGSSRAEQGQQGQECYLFHASKWLPLPEASSLLFCFCF